MSDQAPLFREPVHVGRPNIANRELFLELVSEALDRRWLSNDGPLVRRFEEQVAELLGVRHCVTVVNGTVALEIAMRAAGVTEGEVIVPSWTFVATAHALKWLGLTPVFADIDPVTQCLDPEAVRAKITSNTRAILAVHLWGRTAPVSELQALADEFKLRLIFDAAHAFGVGIGERMVGGFGDAEVLSFHATKFFNAVEGGAVVTNDDEIARTARLMRNFGFLGEDNVGMLGTNGKLTEMSAAMGLANLDGLDQLVAVNRRNYDAYLAGLRGVPGLEILPVGESERSNYQYVVLMVAEDCAAARDEILQELRRNNILARRYFWPACHRMEPYRTDQPDAGADLPVTEAVSERVIVLPTGTAVDTPDIEAITTLIRTFVTTRA